MADTTPATKAGLSGNAPKAADTTKRQSNVKTEGKANLNPAQPSLNQTAPKDVNTTPQVTHLGPDVGAIPPPTYQTPSVHELAVTSAEEAFGPDAHNNPQFDDYVKDREAQMRATLDRTQP